MINKRSKTVYKLLILVLVFVPLACDKWENHYDKALENIPENNLYELIQSKEELSVFRDMLESTGYDEYLLSTQSFTVWAPTNDALSGVDLNDTVLVQDIVLNHIARGNFSTSGLDDRRIKMVNNKNIWFEHATAGYIFGKMEITEENLIANNGQLHVINNYVPYLNNILEYIQRTPGFDSLNKYIASQDYEVLDTANSIEIGIDSNNNSIYYGDYILSNLLLNQIGSLGTEDSLYTVILPDNEGWKEALNRTMPYYKVFETYGGEARQEELAKFAVVKDMVFRGLIEDPSEYSILSSTGQNTFSSPADLFSGSTRIELSNGLAYTTNQMPYSDTASWFKPIKVEAESELMIDNLNSNVLIKSGYGSNFDISENLYVLVDPTSTSNNSKSSIQFEIPDVLSGKYNIYCVFVPVTVTGVNDLRPTKVYSRLTYMSSSGSIRNPPVYPPIDVTNPFGITKMLIGEFEFPFSNITDSDYPDIITKISIINAVTIEEETEGLYTRQMLIDYLILEPVFE